MDIHTTQKCLWGWEPCSEILIENKTHTPSSVSVIISQECKA
uniref:Uncharacterized protein n=1 Tax=Anguilla anguilla TaxID=7936 RepID=A0A0E9VCU0_ANGAN